MRERLDQAVFAQRDGQQGKRDMGKRDFKAINRGKSLRSVDISRKGYTPGPPQVVATEQKPH
jgi:hypothetical protein